MSLVIEFKAIIHDLCGRIDAFQESAIIESWKAFLLGDNGNKLFVPPQRNSKPSYLKWPDININDAVCNKDYMLVSELKKCSDILSRSSDEILHVRQNYGTGILPSLFGCEVAIMPKDMNTLPCCKSVNDRRKIHELIKNGIPDIKNGLGAAVFQTGEMLLQVLSQSEKMSKFIFISPPDLQGPIDAAEIIWGSDIFLAFYDEPETVLAFLDLITQTYIKFMREWFKLVPNIGYTVDWGWMYKGNVMLRNDSLMNLSAGIYERFIKKYDQIILDEFGGRAIHFCGKGDHFISNVSDLKNLNAIHLSQPEMNDLRSVYSATIDKGIRIIGFPREIAEKNNELKYGLIHCPKEPWTRIIKWQ